VTPYDVVVARRSDEAAFQHAVESAVINGFEIVVIGQLIPGTRAIYASAYVVVRYVGDIELLQRAPYLTYRVILIDDLGTPMPTLSVTEGSTPFTTLIEAQNDLTRRYQSP
jgi:hypothetical protein